MTTRKESLMIEDDSTSEVEVALPHEAEQWRLEAKRILEWLAKNLDVIHTAQWVAGFVQLQIDVFDVLGR